MLHPRANPILRGHEAAEAQFVEAFTFGRMPHAWLITGPVGVGKATLAYRVARRLLARAGEGLAVDADHPVFRRVAAGSHADLIAIERAYDEKRKRVRSVIQVEEIRRLTSFLRLTPVEGGWRVAIVDGAEDLNQSAANALLKVLEEPPPRTVLLLIAEAPGRLLPTIRSRCRQLRLRPLDPAAVAEVLGIYGRELKPEQRDQLAALSEGAPGRALVLAEGEGLRLAQLADEILAESPVLDPRRWYQVADAVGRAEDAFPMFIALLRGGLAAAVRAAAGGEADKVQRRLASLRPLEAWSSVWQALGELEDETTRLNLDKRLATLQALELLAGNGSNG
ncbi:MAG: DNA polymerase III subunit delta' [Acetobacteraceae bacterium]|nr:DNA polymerase III subunit delta' [Acetobacteraceae bacterium]